MIKVITIDGPAGSGKSTVAKIVAAKLGWLYVTTGAIYRTLALLFHEANISENNFNFVDEFVETLNSSYRQDSESGRVFLNTRDITKEINTPLISQLSSILAKEETLREKLLFLQRKIVVNNIGAVVDGRDMGTVVFPDSPLKIFLTASAHKRAERRHMELILSGQKIEFNTLHDEINERDLRDLNRAVSPLKPAIDAIVLDSTDSTPECIANIILEKALEKKLIN